MIREERDALLIRVDERTKQIAEWIKTHDDKHFRIGLALWGTVSAAIVALGTAVVSLLRGGG